MAKGKALKLAETIQEREMAYPPPPKWGQDNLSRFIDILRDNQFSTFNNMKEEVDKIISIDTIIEKSLSGHIDPNPIHPMKFLIRSHSVLRSAVSTTLSCQLYEAQPAMRNCLELAAYGFYVWKKPESWTTWSERDKSDAHRKLAVNNFHNDKIKDCLKNNCKPIWDAYKKLYEKFLTLGAHPNPAGVLSGIAIRESNSQSLIETMYIQNSPDFIRGTLKSNLQVGIFIYECFAQIYPARAIADGLEPAVRDLKKAC